MDSRGYFLKIILVLLFLGKVFAFGCDTVGQLGLGIKDDENKVVPTPRQVHSAHLDGYRVLSISLADNHALLLADKNDSPPKIDESLTNDNLIFEEPKAKRRKLKN